MKKEGLSTNESDLNKSNIIKPTLDHLSEEDHKVLESYHKEVDEVFLSRYEVTRQGLVKRDAMSITICKSEVTPEVKNNPSLSLYDVRVKINSTLERQAKSSNEMMRRLIEERDGKKLLILLSMFLLLLLLLLLLVVLILLRLIINPVAHRQVAHHTQTHQPNQ
jgi:hypothetical protein